MKLWLIGAVVVAVASTLPLDVEAKRMGGGKSSGMQRDMPARTSPDAAPGKPAQSQQAAPNTPAAANAAGAAAPKRNWMGPLAGLAAGLGIAALLSHLGMGEGMANIVMMLLIAAVAFFVIRFLLRRFGGGAMAGRQPALAGAAAGAGSAPATGPGSAGWQHVDERPGMQRTALNQEPAFEPASQPSGVAPQGQANGQQVTRAFVPAAFDSEGFSRTAKMIFIRLQAANDTADLDDLRRFTTPELFASLRLDIQERGDAREGVPAQDEQRDPERDQRPDHQPDVGRDEERPALLLAAALGGRQQRDAVQGREHRGLEEEGEEAGHEAVEHACLREREAQPLDGGDLVAHLGLAGDGLDDLAEDVADADGRAEGAHAAAEAEGDRLAGFGNAGAGFRLREGGDDREVHGCLLWIPSAPRRPRRRGRWQ